MKLHLGVLDVAYSDPGATGANTTGEVAEILESKYHVMGLFTEYSRNMDLINEAVADAFAEQIENARMGHSKPALSEIFVDRIDSAFRDYLSSNVIQNQLPDRIQAADEGVSHRFKDSQNRAVSASNVVKRGGGAGLTLVQKKKRAPRPAFIDSGLYQASFRSWIS